LVSQWLVAQGLDRPLNVVIVSATVLNLALALIVAPRFGAVGMAWVTVAVEGYILLGLWRALRRHGLKPILPGLLWRGWTRLDAERRSS
jgi:PST family polysaccharide transporter